MKNESITPNHLALKAIIYIRQSTLHQTLTNQESLKLQYALRDRALELGWDESRIEVIDNDLGLTGSGTEHREGFKSLITQVTMGEVGIILSFDVTRLSRNCSDWYPLLDVCGYRHCLIGDRDGIYDPGSNNGRLLLGLKGQLAEVELNTIRARLTAGLLNKAKRGELAQSLPVGYTRNALGTVVKDPNLDVQSSIERVFEVFLRVKTVSQTLAYFNQHNLLLPRYDKFKQLYWRKPNIGMLYDILKNPTYAGVFVFGKTRRIKTGPSVKDKKTELVPRDQWKIVIPEKYPGYISFETFDKIEAMMKQNYSEYRKRRSRGVARNGAALLQGIIFCGKCGHKLTTQYKTGNHYLCNYLKTQYRLPTCQFILADILDNYVVECFFQAVSPIELNAYEASIKEQEKEASSIRQAKSQQLQRLEYQAKLAESQFNEVDPNNRLVAVELEKRWEIALRELQHTQQAFDRLSNQRINISISDEMKNIFSDIGKKLPELWKEENLSHKQKKSFLRCLIEKIIVCREERDNLSVRIVWKGNEVTESTLPIPVNSFRSLSFCDEMEEKVITLSREGKSAKFIAEKLTQEGYRSPRKSYVLVSTVTNIRLKNRILNQSSQSHPLKKQGYLSISDIAKAIEVNNYWVYDRIRKGQIQIEKHSRFRAYLFPAGDKTIEAFKRLKNGHLCNLDFRKECQHV